MVKCARAVSATSMHSRIFRLLIIIVLLELAGPPGVSADVSWSIGKRIATTSVLLNDFFNNVTPGSSRLITDSEISDTTKFNRDNTDILILARTLPTSESGVTFTATAPQLDDQGRANIEQFLSLEGIVVTEWTSNPLWFTSRTSGANTIQALPNLAFPSSVTIDGLFITGSDCPIDLHAIVNVHPIVSGISSPFSDDFCNPGAGDLHLDISGDLDGNGIRVITTDSDDTVEATPTAIETIAVARRSKGLAVMMLSDWQDLNDPPTRLVTDIDPDIGQLWVNVANLNVNNAPSAGNDSYATDEDTTLMVGARGVLANDSDVDGDALTAVRVSGPTNGTLTLNANGSFTYTPRSNFNGSDSFTYQARDPSLALSNLATVTITVKAVNDAPTAFGQSVITAEDTAVLITLNGSDIDSTNLSFSVLGGPSHGVLSAGSGAMSCTPGPTNGTTSGATCTAKVTYTPAGNYNGSDSFTFIVTDGALNSDSATVSITVTAVNDPPVLTVPGPITVNEGTPISFPVTATDVDSPPPLSFSVSNLPSGATLTPQQNGTSAVFTWTPSSAQGGPNPYLVQISVSDGQLSDTKVVSITVNDTIADRDGDGVPDAMDNCPDDPNATQADVCHNSPQPVAATQSVTRVDNQIPVTFTTMVSNDKTDISFLPPTLFTVNCKVINSTGSVIPISRIPEAGPFILNLGEASRPGDLVKIAPRATATFSTTFDLRIYYPDLPNGKFTTVCTYVQFGQILNPTVDDPPLWTGEIQAPPQTIFVGAYTFSGFFFPLPDAKFSQTNTVPVKFALKDSAGAFVTNCTCTLTYQQLDSNGNPIGSPVPATSTTGGGNQFKYDFKNNQYIFTVASRSLPVGRVQLQANLHDGSPLRTINIVITP